MSERRAASDPIPASERIVAADAEPGRWIFVLHGIYGAGRNWGRLARDLARRRPDWGAVLVDLREHGDSRGFPPPHTIAAAAADLDRVAASTDDSPAAILGHSFGGKVALAFADRRPPGLRQVWLADSTPAAREPSGSAWRMLSVLRGLPGDFDSRAAGIEALRSAGLEPPVAEWMATNLEREDDRYRWRFDLDALEALLRDFFATDLWRVLEEPPPGITIHVIRARESSVLEGDDLERVRRAAEATGRVHLHELGGGHWLNVDNPAGVLDLLERHLPGAA